MSVVAGRGRRRWEQRLLAALAYPANLAFIGVAAFLLALPVITAFPAAVAAGRTLARWLRDGEDATFTATFREFAATWRRTLPWGVLAAVVVGMLAVNAVFLADRVISGAGLVAAALLPATVVLTAAALLFLVAVPVAATRSPDAGMRAWLAEAGYLVARRPVRSVVLVLIVAAFAFTCYLLPTIAPFLGISVPVYLALVSLGDSPRRP